MTLAGILSMVLIATLPRVLRLEGGARLVPVWLVSVVALALTYVRGAWVGLAAGAVVVLLTVRRRSVVAITAGGRRACGAGRASRRERIG